MTNILHVLILNQNIIDKRILITLKKLVNERLSQTINDFSNILENITYCYTMHLIFL
jgi:hypothetical protein